MYCIVLFWAKILEENIQLPFFTSMGMNGNVAKESHIYGAIGGILYSLVFIPGFRLALQRMFRRSVTE
jgi:membrane associated rhomboid family serine protease